MDARVDLNPIARLADEACAITALDLPATVLHAAKRCVIDWYATTLPGTVDMTMSSGTARQGWVPRVVVASVMVLMVLHCAGTGSGFCPACNTIVLAAVGWPGQLS